MANIRRFLIILMSSILVDGFKKCCEGENEITFSVKTCPNSKPLNISKCRRYALERNETEIIVDDTGNLVVSEYDIIIPPDE